MIEVKITDDLDFEEYNKFVQESSNNMIYHTSSFLLFLEKTVKGKTIFFCAYIRGCLVGVLPCIMKTTSFGSIMNSLPWYGTYGSIITLIDCDEVKIKEVLIKTYNNYLKNKELITSTLISSPFEKNIDLYEKYLTNDLSDERICQISTLPNDDDFDNYIMTTVKQKTRNLIRKSYKQNFVLRIGESDEDWNYLFETHKVNMESIGALPKPIEHFDNLRTFIPEARRKLYIASFNGQPVAAILVLFYGDVAEYLVPVISLEYRSKQALSFLIWEGMKDAVEKGVKFWNWGGTWKSQKSLHHFKSGWGAEDYKYKYFVSTSEKIRKMSKLDLDALRKESQNFYLFPY